MKLSVWGWLIRLVLRILHPNAKTRQFGHMQHMHNMMRAQANHEELSARSTTFHKEYGRVTNMLECSQMDVLYYADSPGPVPSVSQGASTIGLDIGNGGLPPQWGTRLTVWNAMIHYGPWTDRQR